jgi:hypothetical protein
MLLCCLAIATHKVLLYEAGDDALVREVSRWLRGFARCGGRWKVLKCVVNESGRVVQETFEL